MATGTIQRTVEIQSGIIPSSVKTGTTQTAGWYASSVVTVNFQTAFSTVPKVMIQEVSGNTYRFFRYRLVAVTATGFSVMLQANEPNYSTADSQWIAIAG